MSHFIALVMLDQEEIKDVEASVERRMAPYCADMELPPYEAVCSCKEWTLFSDVNLKLHEEKQDMETYRRDFAYWSVEREADYNLDDEDERRRFNEEMNQAWDKHIEPHFRRRDEIKQELEKTAVFDPHCDECNGTGTFMSTHNIHSKWDWFVIGGRWDAFFSDREPGDQYTSRIDGNIASVQEAKSYVEEKLPYAVVSPDGWHECDQMQLFEKKELPEWRDEVMALYDRYPDHHVVAVDYHY